MAPRRDWACALSPRLFVLFNVAVSRIHFSTPLSSNPTDLPSSRFSPPFPSPRSFTLPPRLSCPLAYHPPHPTAKTHQPLPTTHLTQLPSPTLGLKHSTVAHPPVPARISAVEHAPASHASGHGCCVRGVGRGRVGWGVVGSLRGKGLRSGRSGAVGGCIDHGRAVERLVRAFRGTV